MAQHAGPMVTPNPYTYDSGDDGNGKHLIASFAWDAGTRLITGITAIRDAGCLFTMVLVGLGAGNSPNTTTRSFVVPDGVTSVPNNILNQLAARGLGSIDDLLTTQITAA
jgi:hypothetical protein